jgi:hypothetical protein
MLMMDLPVPRVATLRERSPGEWSRCASVERGSTREPREMHIQDREHAANKRLIRMHLYLRRQLRPQHLMFAATTA